ncbi:MAG TPA: ATP-binding protein [Actinomycetota bacterium]|nr:ATP-binding protein [Actinomycetota bacterium]
MQLVTPRERDLIAQAAPVLLPRMDALAGEWRATVGTGFPADLGDILRSALTDGLDAGLDGLRGAAADLIARRVGLEDVVGAVLTLEEGVNRCLARHAIEEVFTTSAAFARFLHELVLLVAEGYSSAYRRALDDERRGAAEADRLKTELISMISHDLKTPLTTIEACAESMLKADDLPPDQSKRFLEMILRNAERLTRLITRIVDVSRIEARAVELVLVPLDLVRLVSRIADSILPSASLRLDLPEDLPLVLADRDAMERVVVNLIDNAVRFSPPGEPVVVHAHADATHVELRIVDLGPGIPPDRRAGLFSKFFQVDPSDSARRSGSGLGLAIVRGLAEAMGGDAGYVPNKPSGSIFWVRIPAVRRTAPARGGVA